jgi:hypothetical protein
MRVKKPWLEFFRKAVQEMNYRSPVYRMLKKELSAKGYWRNKRRGPGDAERFRGSERD